MQVTNPSWSYSSNPISSCWQHIPGPRLTAGENFTVFSCSFVVVVVIVVVVVVVVVFVSCLFVNVF